MKRARRAGLLLAVTAIVCAPLAAAQAGTQQHEGKATFLAAMPGFVVWPEATFKTPTAALHICVHGDFSFGTGLAELVRGESVGAHRVEVKWVRKEQDLAACQLLFVSHSAVKRYDKVLEVVKNSATLTIGEEPEFLNAGGMICLQPAPPGVSFDVNIDAVRDAHIKLSSQLLSLARHIVRRADSASS